MINRNFKKKRKIKLPLENVEKMAKAFNASKVGIYNALAYRSESERARMIREEAIKFYGGIEVTEYIER